MACIAAGDTAEAATVAVAVRDSTRSRRAVLWAARYLFPHAHRVLLLHVIPSVSSIPSPSGLSVPIQEMERDVVEMYIEDVKSLSSSVFYPFKRLCGRKNVETLVLEGKDPARALAEYAAESGIQNLVMGTSSFAWFRRIMKGQDVPTTVIKLAPISCNVFVVSQWRLTIKFASHSVINEVETNKQINRMSWKDFSHWEQNVIFSKEISVHSSEGNETLLTSTQSENSSFSQAYSADTTASTLKPSLVLPHNGHHEDQNFGNTIQGVYRKKEHDVLTSPGNMPFIIYSPKEGEALAEVERLRPELENALAIYNKTCEDLVHAKRKVQLLSNEYSDETIKVKDSLKRNDIYKQIATEEKAKHLKATKEIQESMHLLSKEALNRYKAETTAGKLSSENSEVVHAYSSNGKRCNIYKRSEIEFATGNFSDAKKIGEGSYGDVYKCNLDHMTVAVKVLRQGEIDKNEEFLKEVELLSHLRHPHMLLLLGVCPEIGCLVYEYMENGSLEDQLFYREGTQPLPWYIRFRIVFEVACGLAFLHASKPEPIVHRDLKPGNILLDRNYVSKIGDVGLAKLLSDVVPDGLTEYKETVLAGTLYYMDPEYQRTGTIRPKSDLYALGIIVLQLLTAKHPRGLVMHVENAIRDGCFGSLLDGSVSDWPHAEAEKLAIIALKCSRLRCRDRPDLETEILPELEKLLSISNVCFKLRQCNVSAPSHYLCPILQEIMDDPYVAADGYTYEYRAIKSWLEKHKVSPVTKLSLSNTTVIPNHTLRSAIQEWSRIHNSQPSERKGSQ